VKAMVKLPLAALPYWMEMAGMRSLKFWVMGVMLVFSSLKPALAVQSVTLNCQEL